MITGKIISDYINEIAPYSTEMEWDNCGFLVGDGEKSVKKVGFCLDLTEETLKQGVAFGVDLIVTHHPVIFKAQKSFLKGNIAFEAAAAGIGVLSAHTCYDAADGGVNDVLCELLELRNIRSIDDGCVKPILRMGEREPISPADFARFAAKKLGTCVSFTDGKKPITKVAVCGGAGGDFAETALLNGADAYVTGEARHHELLYAQSAGLTLVVGGHFETENPAMKALQKRFSARFPEIETVWLQQKNPVEYVF